MVAILAPQLPIVISNCIGKFLKARGELTKAELTLVNCLRKNDIIRELREPFIEARKTMQMFEPSVIDREIFLLYIH